MSFELRLLTDTDVPALQAVYDARPDAFTRLIGRRALPDQAAADFVQALSEPGRYQFGISIEDELAGVADLRLDPEIEGAAHIGLLLLAPPYNDADITALVLRILERWLAQAYAVSRLETGVPAQDVAELAFWQQQGYAFTGGQYRRDLPGYAPRFLVLAKTLPR
jgi:hypothetical protein